MIKTFYFLNTHMGSNSPPLPPRYNSEANSGGHSSHKWPAPYRNHSASFVTFLRRWFMNENTILWFSKWSSNHSFYLFIIIFKKISKYVKFCLVVVYNIYFRLIILEQQVQQINLSFVSNLETIMF